MELIHIIVDRIEKSVIFNVVDKYPQKFTHIKSLIDDDLINEYLHEINRFSKIANSSVSGNGFQSQNLHTELRKIGEAIYRQLIPDALQIFFKMKGSGSLFFHIDDSLRKIPWELLHDGNAFLADKFFIGRNINGQWRPHEFQEFERLNVLIVADPAENLDWARQEGEQLYENLIAEVSPDRIDLQYLSGRRATKLRLLNALEDRNVIHFAGHVYHDSQNPEESGWVLKDNKILRAREIKNSGTAPLLVFSNSCLSSPLQQVQFDDNHLSDLASSFLFSGIGNYIGTNWEIKDNKNSSEFALKFYKEIFDEKSVGAALAGARKNANSNLDSDNNDLTWANYVLHGNPDTIIYKSGQRRSFDASRLPGYIEKVIGTHPLPIARSYENFLLLTQTHETEPRLALKSLCNVLENTLILAGSIVFSRMDAINKTHKLFSMKSADFLEWNKYLFKAVELLIWEKRFEYLKRFLDGLVLHRENINKLVKWYELILDNTSISEIDEESYLIGFQFYLDNLLSDLFISSNDLLLYTLNDEEVLLLNGNQIRIFSGTELKYLTPGIKQNLYEHLNEICYLQKNENVLFSLHPYIQYDPDSGDVQWPDLKFNLLNS